MGIINILDKNTANMIAAGEVVDRPASAVKELIENSIDAGATSIEVEIKDGGRSLIRVTDNGRGFLRDDMPRSLLRHATSKIRFGNDLDGVKTLGFRGEALAAISSVSRMEIISKHSEDQMGTRLSSDEEGVIMDDTGCPEGTTVIVRDLFYPTPARQKFLKKDSAEATAVSAVIEKTAISRPDIAFCYISNGEKKLHTPGDGKLRSVLYAIYGREFASAMLPVDYTLDGVRAYGFISVPQSPRGSRAMQSFFVNGRFVRSRTAQTALEEAFRSFIPHGKYPAAIIFVEINPHSIDVNVHPAKLEIKFSDERAVFHAVYYAVLNALSGTENKNEDESSAKQPDFNSKPYRAAESIPNTSLKQSEVFRANMGEEDLPLIRSGDSSEAVLRQPESTSYIPQMIFDIKENQQETFAGDGYVKVIGEAYNAYIFAETAERVYIIDKHAAHERIIYERIKNKRKPPQMLMAPVSVTLTPVQAGVLTENSEYLSTFGFEIEPFGDSTVLIRSVPFEVAEMADEDITAALERFAEDISEGSGIPFEQRVDSSLFNVACKAALKAGEKSHAIHSEQIAQALIDNPALRVCPHGRPLLKEFTKKEIGRFFDR